jgi:hypothetical protein
MPKESFLNLFCSITEQYDFQQEHQKIFQETQYPADYKGHAVSSVIITKDVLSPFTADVCGILLPSVPESDGATMASTKLVNTPTVSAAMYSVALALSLKMPILVQGPDGCGKTSVLEEVARRAGQKGDLFTQRTTERV